MSAKHNFAAKLGFFFMGVLISTSTIQAKQLWSDNSLSLLRGGDYKVYADETQTVLTFEHASGHSWGDMFLFVDRLEADKLNPNEPDDRVKRDNGNDTYWEVSPRLSAGKLLSKDLSMGPIKDILLASTAEISEHQTSYLVGPGVDLSVSGFSHLSLNFYRRNNEGSGDDNWQLTTVWGVPFSLGNQQFVYDGFIDWVSGDGDTTSQTNFTSQFKWDLGALWQTPKTLYLGIEYVYWNNRFGIQDTDAFETNERNVNGLLKLHF